MRLAGLVHPCGEASQRISLGIPANTLITPHSSRMDAQVLSIIYMGLGATTAVNLRAVSGPIGHVLQWPMAMSHTLAMLESMRSDPLCKPFQWPNGNLRHFSVCAQAGYIR